MTQRERLIEFLSDLGVESPPDTYQALDEFLDSLRDCDDAPLGC